MFNENFHDRHGRNRRGHRNERHHQNHSRRRRHHCPPVICWRTIAFYLTLGLVLVFGAAAHAKEHNPPPIECFGGEHNTYCAWRGENGEIDTFGQSCSFNEPTTWQPCWLENHPGFPVNGAAAHAKEFKLQRWLSAQTDMAEIKARECPADKTLSCEILCHGPEIKCWPMFEKIIDHSLKCEGRGTGLTTCEDKRAHYEWSEMNLHETTITKVPK